jgi:3-dehydroquinate synthase
VYPVHVEPGILVLLRELLEERLPGRNLVMIADEKVDHLYDEWTSGTVEARRLGARASDAGMRPRFLKRLVFPQGERSKTRATWSRLTDEMLADGLGRDSAIVAMGGGVTGDLAGFVAATYLRGIPYVQVPTTLLAMVDAAVGGKVGVDTELGKNQVGAFYPPVMVVADPLTLMSLPDREYRAGLAEAVKHGVIADREYFDWIVSQGRDIRARQPAAVTRLVQRSIEIKAGVVSQDERERGRRAILNAGHTVAHGIEVASGYQLHHGECVAIGLTLEAALAESMGIAETGTAATIARVLERFGLPLRLPSDLSPQSVLEVMARDKKNRAGEIHFSPPTGIGTMWGKGNDWTVASPPETILSILSNPSINIST